MEDRLNAHPESAPPEAQPLNGVSRGDTQAAASGAQPGSDLPRKEAAPPTANPPPGGAPPGDTQVVEAQAQPDVGSPQAKAPLQPEELPTPKRTVDLSTVVLPGLGDYKVVDRLAVRELKGAGATFTPNLEGALAFHGLVYKPKGTFEPVHQIICGPLLTNARVVSRAQRVVFVPVFDWGSLEIVLLPIKQTTYGQRVLVDLQQTQKKQSLHFKAFIQWEERRHRHVVYHDDLSEQEKTAVAQAKWPTREQILEDLSTSAYNDINELAEANPEIRTLLRAREVD
jgi:hypothetical protein